MAAPGGTVSAAVREHLQQLCLHEFPCGVGSWNKSRFLPQTWRTWRGLVPREEEAGSPEEETVEDLLGLVCSPQSPWALPEGSSAEDRFLRELAIRNPLMLKDTFLYSYFRSLQVVDKQVSLVDKDLLKFRRLEELVLSANQIKEIDAVNLPPTLKVLEVYGNSITSMECLCARPPPRLQHLGLGHNKLLGPLQSLYVTSEHWPNLVSLDLSFNDLTDLQGMIASLRTLQCLRLLVLQGNPLALVPYYRGFTIDSLARLCVLDDITVSSSEKHQFRGLRHSGDFLAHEAQLVVTIGNVRGVLDTSILDPEPGPQGPFTSYSYYVTYDFVEDEEGEGHEYGGVLAEIVKPSPSVEQLGEEVPEEITAVTPAAEEAEDSAESVPATTSQSPSQSQSAELEESLASGGSPSPSLRRSIDSAGELAKLRPRMDPRLCPSPGTVLFSTVRKPWADVMPCNYEMQHTLRDLVPLKAFLLAGTTVTIVEEKILSWPAVPPPVDNPLPAKKGKGAKDEKGKEEKETKAQKGAKKKKEVSKDLRQDPPVLRVLGSGLVVLEPLLAGEPLVSTVCNFGVIRTLESDRMTFLRESKNKKAKKALEPGKSRSKMPTLPADDSDYRPEPLTVEVRVQLNQCRSKEEALRAVVV
ncbi:leucine-rich repeat-containing protein 43 [Molossus molossus]|uniref:leucine-rich repeat-containing protein 43 n=1 Tax=Molossus molossus TaxID=27622 RepID=UPI001746E1A3|nr:leucine-rich repeat-containing protein 43 [Molossus molossus]